MGDKPANAKQALEAGKGKEGQVTELQHDPVKPGQYKLDSVKLSGGGDEEAEEKGTEEETHQIVIELQDDQKKPVSTLPSGAPIKFQLKVAGKLYEGTLDLVTQLDKATGKLKGKSRAVVTGLPAGNVDVSFPDIHADEWKRVATQELS
jgi:hypothetical protein